MVSSIYAIYLRYVARHADRLGGFSMPRRRGRKLGHVERIWRVDGITRIAGWTSATALRVSWPGGEVHCIPHIQRPDVMHRFGLRIDCGFEIDIPEAARDLTLHVTPADGRDIALPLAHPADPPSRAARRRLWRAFFVDLVRATPTALRARMRHDPAARTRLKHLLGLEVHREGLPIDPRFLGYGPTPRARHPITIIVPVHDAFDALVACLRRVSDHTDVAWHAIVIDDASTDPRIRPFLRSWAEAHEGRVTLLELTQNLGFVGAVNRGFAVAEGHMGHVVLLNSDAMVPADWASRLIAPFDRDPRIASVTPMSNNAEIFSVPFMCEALPLAAGMVDRLDTVAQSLSMPDPLPSAPTGVGFCMAINARWFGREPRFDADFGRGYGEEVDWCQKTRLSGARHVGLPTLFVEHRGGESFGAETKRKAVLRANAMIARRYPSYDLEVQRYITDDPLRTARLALAIAVAGELAIEHLPLFLAHAMGGGADHALRAEIATYTAQGQYALVLRVGGPVRWQLEVHGPLGVISGVTEQFAHICRLLAPIPLLRIVYSCGVGDRNPIELPDAMMALMRPDRADRLEARLHDYFVISPSYCLLNADGSYRGPVLRDNRDPAHRHHRPEGGIVALTSWQTTWESFLKRCNEITVFSEASKQQLLAVYPTLAPSVVYRPHATIAQIARIDPMTHAPSTLAVLGNLNRQKGAGVLCDLAERLARVGGPKLVLIGNIDPAFSLPPSVRMHGSYVPSDIPHLAERYGVGAWLVPSIWPETFSFVTHEMLATGLPVFGFDLGAQGDALRRAANGIPVPFDPDGDHAAAIVDMLAARGPWRAVHEATLLHMDKAAE